MAEQAPRRYLPAIAANAATTGFPSSPMSTIGSSDPHLNQAGLARLDGQVSLEELRGRDPGQAAGLEQLHGTAPAPEARGATTDAGEDVLNAPAWDGIPAGQRLLAGDQGFEARLGAMDLSGAADSAADAILSAIG